MRGRGIGAAALLMVLAVLFGLCWRLKPHQEPLRVEAVCQNAGDREGSPVVSMDETAEGGVAFRNQGRLGCRLRVRLCVAQVDGKPVLEAGAIRDGSFQPAGTGGPEGTEYWTARGEYLYYENTRTQGLLLPGQETPPVYTAVRLNQELEPEDLETLEVLVSEQQVFVLADAEQA